MFIYYTIWIYLFLMNYVAGLYAGCMYIVSLKIVISYKNQNKIPIQIKAL